LSVQPETASTRFRDLNLHPIIQESLTLMGFDRPTDVQAALIPPALTGQDVIGKSQTGTGKTAAYVLPILQQMIPIRNRPGPLALVLAPTRELVSQITEHSHQLIGRLPFEALSITGGERYKEQLNGLRRGAHLVIGTPGRLIDHLERGTLRTQMIRFIVLDEADRMLDIGFRDDIETILRRCPKDRQTYLISATLPPPVLRLSQRYMRNPVMLDLSSDSMSVESIRQTHISVPEDQKFFMLLKVFAREHPKQCIIFTRTKRGADELHRDLKREHQAVAVLHGDLPQEKRNKIMAGFREGKLKFLVATDVVSRGIDVTDISHIINYDLPDDPENYVHRIGRTGRMGRDGVAIAFVTPDQGDLLTAIEILINKLIEPDPLNAEVARPSRQSEPSAADAEPEKPKQPVFGKRTKRYNRAL
jgi:ATP-dependent RNA helicase DeaD